MLRTVLAWSMVGVVTVSALACQSSDGAPSAETRQQAFRGAAQEFGVPESVLLGVSYMESRWDSNGGRPSRAAGYGPMHLTGAGSLARAAALTGLDEATLRTDPEQNIRGGAALLAEYQRELVATGPHADPAEWYGAVAHYSGAMDRGAARQFADDVYDVIAEGNQRVTDDGQRVELTAQASLQPRKAQLDILGLRASVQGDVECPPSLDCEWIPAPYQELGEGKFGNHDLSDRPRTQQITHIVIHDVEGSYSSAVSDEILDPHGVSWHYTIRSNDGHVAQHVKTKDVGWQAGNWYINSKSIGIEHEGFAAQGTWYTEAMYRSSARLVRYLAARYGVPLDRAHILGHDTVAGPTPDAISDMHWDPGPYWDWAHYFALLGAPFRATGGPHSGLVTIAPDWARNQPSFFGCDDAHPEAVCPARPSSSVILHTEPRVDAPLLDDVGTHPTHGASSMHVSDIGSRASTGQQYAIADRSGDWTAIWYLGQKGWFYNPPSAPSALPASGLTVTPKPGRASIPVYGRPYPEAEAYPSHVPVQAIVPLQYELRAGQRYSVGHFPSTEYLWAGTFDPSEHVVVRGRTRYFQIQFGHRIAYVMADDVELQP
ncbi:N-acetylmuramoyl-L-alanine amidase [Pendulispora rubella]|uniref:N-acetylmuramoyl-L-alanine amidase n=1 Tax=Pendulispora rubella TaxID=2741070 RepID=A0ABZ2L0Q3_9BACT